MQSNNIPLHQNSSGQVYTYNAFGQVPVNYTPAKYALSDLAIKNSDHYFSKYDPQRTDSLSVNQIAPIIQEIFASENQPAPQSFDVAYLLNKYDINNDGRISHREFKRLLRELTGKRLYDKSIFRTFNKPAKSSIYVIPTGGQNNFGQQNVHPVNSYNNQQANPLNQQFQHVNQQTHIPNQQYQNQNQGLATNSYNQNVGYNPLHQTFHPNNVYNPPNYSGNNVFGAVAPNYVPLVYTLSKDGLKKSEHIFKTADIDHDGFIPINQSQNVFRTVFETDGKPAPQSTDLAHIFNKYRFDNAHLLSYPEFKRALKELTGTKSFSESTIGAFRYRAPNTQAYVQPNVQPSFQQGGLNQQFNPNSNIGGQNHALFAPLPQGYVPKTYAVSKNAINGSKNIFKKYSLNNGFITTDDLLPALGEVFAIDNHPAPQTNDIAFLLHKFQMVGGNQITMKQFRRILKELSGTKAYSLSSFNFMKKVFA